MRTRDAEWRRECTMWLLSRAGERSCNTTRRRSKRIFMADLEICDFPRLPKHGSFFFFCQNTTPRVRSSSKSTPGRKQNLKGTSIYALHTLVYMFPDSRCWTCCSSLNQTAAQSCLKSFVAVTFTEQVMNCRITAADDDAAAAPLEEFFDFISLHALKGREDCEALRLQGWITM